MKKVALSIIASFCMVGLVSAQTQTSTTAATPNPNAAEITFKKDVHDFGTLKNGAPAEYEFEFTNTGKEPLIISDAKGSCGCTVPQWPKEPIAPGKSGKIKVTYDSKRTGNIDKKVTITSNAKTNPKEIFIKGNVLAPEDQNNLAPVKTNPGAPANK